MTKEEVYENLCIYDERNPDYIYKDADEDDDKEVPEDCYCDSCFRGNNILALEILRLLEKECK